MNIQKESMSESEAPIHRKTKSSPPDFLPSNNLEDVEFRLPMTGNRNGRTVIVKSLSLTTDVN